jgi:[ribosomal protein S18]-alanine N-acetyltransferase
MPLPKQSKMLRIDQVSKNMVLGDTTPLTLQDLLLNLSSEWTSTQTFWSFESLCDHLALKDTASWALVDSHQGFIGFILFNVQNTEAELLYLHIAMAHRHKGWGHVILQEAVNELQKLFQVDTIFLEVRPTNHSALKLYSDFGFWQIGLRKQYYHNGDDALILQWKSASQSP